MFKLTRRWLRVAISCRLLDDEGFYNATRSAISERKQRLFHDTSVAEAFQVAVETVCRQAPAVGQQPSGLLSLTLPLSTTNNQAPTVDQQAA